MLKDGVKHISTLPPPQKKKNISQTSMNYHVQLKIVKFTILRKERKTTDLYIEIVQANFFVVFALLSFFRNLWNCDQFAHSFLITCVQLIFFGC